MPLKARPNEIRAAGRARGWMNDTTLAAGLKLDPAHVHRVLRGSMLPGNRFINACVRELGGPLAFGGLFADEPDDEKVPA